MSWIDETRPVQVTVNGTSHDAHVPSRLLLSDFLRHQTGATGVHVGCEHGVCGACTVLLDGTPVRSCLVFAVQADGQHVTTVEGVSPADGWLSEVQETLQRCQGLQCGFCTPGFVVSIEALLGEDDVHDGDIEAVLSSHICRCTGYYGIHEAVRELVARRFPALDS